MITTTEWPSLTNSLASKAATVSIPPKLGAKAAYAKQAIRDKLMEHKEYICRHGDDMPEISGWRWGQEAASAASSSTEGDNV